MDHKPLVPCPLPKEAFGNTCWIPWCPMPNELILTMTTSHIPSAHHSTSRRTPSMMNFHHWPVVSLMDSCSPSCLLHCTNFSQQSLTHPGIYGFQVLISNHFLWLHLLWMLPPGALRVWHGGPHFIPSAWHQLHSLLPRLTLLAHCHLLVDLYVPVGTGEQVYVLAKGFLYILPAFLKTSVHGHSLWTQFACLLCLHLLHSILPSLSTMLSSILYRLLTVHDFLHPNGWTTCCGHCYLNVPLWKRIHMFCSHPWFSTTPPSASACPGDLLLHQTLWRPLMLSCVWTLIVLSWVDHSTGPLLRYLHLKNSDSWHGWSAGGSVLRPPEILPAAHSRHMSLIFPCILAQISRCTTQLALTKGRGSIAHYFIVHSSHFACWLWKYSPAV